MAPTPCNHTARRRQRLLPATVLLASLALVGCATAQQQATTGADRFAAAGSPQAMLQLAARTESSGNADAAREIYGKLVARYPEQPAGHLGLARTSYRSGAPAEAAQHYRTALTYAPQSVDARYGLGKALLAADRPRAAIEQFDRLVAQEAADTRPYVAKGVALDMLGRHEQAQPVYRKGLELAPMNVALRTNLGLSLALTGDYKTAVRVLEDAARDPKATARTRQNLALVYGLAGKMGDAATAASADLGDGAVRRNLAYYRALRSARAISDVAAEPRVRPDAPDAGAGSTQLAAVHATTGPDGSATAEPAAARIPPVAEAAPVPLTPDAGAPAMAEPSSDTAAQAADPASADLPRDPADAAEAATDVRDPASGVATTGDAKPDREPASAGSYWVQVGALRSQTAAKLEWDRLKGAHANLLADLRLALQKAELPEKGTYYRLRAGPFADTGRPEQLCQALEERQQACLVVRSRAQS